MTTENLTLMKAIGAKMNYLNQRQKIISQNVANADTPGYKPQDLKPVDFGSVLENVTKSSSVHLETTSGKHLTPGGEVRDPRQEALRDTYEVEPTGNAVTIEEQLLMSNRTVMDYNLMTNIYNKQMGMMRTAVGQGR